MASLGVETKQRSQEQGDSLDSRLAPKDTPSGLNISVTFPPRCVKGGNTHSHMRVHHPYHLHLVFERCHCYQIRLNHHKCIFCVKVSHLLGFIVSKEGISVDPFKFEEIIQLSPPCNIRHIQCLQGMEKFLKGCYTVESPDGSSFNFYVF